MFIDLFHLLELSIMQNMGPLAGSGRPYMLHGPT